MRLFLLTLFTALGLAIAPASFAVDANLSWTHPTTYENNDPLPETDIRETVVEWGRCVNGAFPVTAEGTKTVLGPTAVTIVQGLAGNTLWCFRAATVTNEAQRSDWSNTATGIWLRKPKPPKMGALGNSPNSMTVVIEQ